MKTTFNLSILLRKIKNTILEIRQSPTHALARALNILFRFKGRPQIERLREITRQTPLILQIETVNACNAACIFCAYPEMKRKKGIMTVTLFEKIVKEYVEMGGGPISFTPVVGDALLDPHLIERLIFLEKFTSVNQITLTTNGIALHKYSDDMVRYLLTRLYCIQVSIGGLDRDTYKTLYGVDSFNAVNKTMKRLIRLRKCVDNPANLTFAFRTNDGNFTKRFKSELAFFRQEGVFISHISNYDNYSGVVTNACDPSLTINNIPSATPYACTYPSVHIAICWDGTITACGCVDFEGDKLPIGNASSDSLFQVWTGAKRTELLDSFTNNTLPNICRECTAYIPDTYFAMSFFKDVRQHNQLPLCFFQSFWGG